MVSRHRAEEAKMARFSSAWGEYCSLSCLFPRRRVKPAVPETSASYHGLLALT